MKAAVPVLVILALLSALLLTGASAALAQDCDKVVLTETVLAGDTSRAAGLSVTASSHCRDHLLWESRFSVGRLEELETDFSLSQEEVLDGYRTSDFAGDCLSLSFFEGGISSSGSLEDAVAEDVMLQSIFALAKDVASRAEPGGEHTETVDLAAYYEYVPLYADLYGIPGVTPEKELALTRLLQDYFRIPVPEGWLLEITVETLSDGSLCSVSVNSLERQLDLYGDSVQTGDSILFVSPLRFSDGSEPDLSRIPGGRGIYRFSGLAAQEYTLSTAYSLPEQAVPVRFWAEEEALFLLTQEEGVLRLRILDPETVTVRQTLDLLPWGEDDPFCSVYRGDGFFVPITQSESARRLAVVEQSGAGAWQRNFVADWSLQKERDCYLSGSVNHVSMAWDGVRLAVSGSWGDRGSWGNSFYLAVYTREGLTFLAAYENSLDGNSVSGVNMCQPRYYRPRVLAWEAGA